MIVINSLIVFFAFYLFLACFVSGNFVGASIFLAITLADSILLYNSIEGTNERIN